MAVTSLDDAHGVERTGWIAGALLAERDRWPLWIPVGLGLGIALYFSLTVEPAPYFGALAALISALIAFAARRRLAWAMAAVALLLVCLGFTAAQVRSARVAAPVLSQDMRFASVSGRVLESQTRINGQRLVLDHVSIKGLEAAATPERLRITLRGGKGRRALPGEWLSLRAALSPPSEPAAPGAFDFARQAYFKRLGGFGFAYGGARFIDPPKDAQSGGWGIAIGRFRQAVTMRIQAGLEGESGAVAAALLTGERGAISKPTMAAIRDAGLAHLLAISGLHMGLIAGIVFFAIRALLALWEPIALRHGIKKWAACAALAGMAFYLLLSGATIPTQRAFMMGALVIAAVLLDRTAISMRSVALAAVAVLLVQPESLLGPSFQMSFAAVVALVAVFEVLGQRFWKSDTPYHWSDNIRRYFIGVSLMTVIANLATGPFAVYSFNRFAVYGLAANLIAVPLTALWIMPWGVVVLLLMPFGFEALALAPMGWGIDGLITVAQTVAAWPGSVKLLPAMPDAGLAAAAAGGLWLCLWRGRWRLVGAPIFALALLSPAMSSTPDLLIDGKGKLFAVRTETGEIALSSRKAARFTGDIWLRRDGQLESAPWPGAEPERLRCDGAGCIYRNQGRLVALVSHGRALAEDCRAAAIIVSAVPVRRSCPSASLIIDRFDLWRKGAHALYFGDDGSVRVVSVGEIRGTRPWAPRKKPAAKK